jgi:hypothetical protein
MKITQILTATVLFAVQVFMTSCASSSTPGLPSQKQSFTTNFSATESPISEGGNWTVPSQKGAGSLWGDVQTASGMAYGVSQPTVYGDPTAIVTGNWGADQSVTGIVRIPTTPGGNCCNEVELRLRTAIASNSITGYEVYCSVLPTNPYCHIARWNGANGSFCNLDFSPPSIYLKDGDVLTGTVTGENPAVVTLYVNGTQEIQVEDTGSGDCPSGGSGAAGPFTNGNPGVGFYDSQDNNWQNFGFSCFSTTDMIGGDLGC